MQQKTAQHYAHETGNEIHLKAGQKVVLDAGSELTIKAGGSFVKLDGSGVTMLGPQLKLNQGGSAGSGKGVAPKPPKPPLEVGKGGGAPKAAPPPGTGASTPTGTNSATPSTSRLVQPATAPVNQPKKYDEQVKLIVQNDGASLAGIPYFIETKEGKVYSGHMGEDGLLPRIDTKGPEDYTVYWGDEALARKQS